MCIRDRHYTILCAVIYTNKAKQIARLLATIFTEPSRPIPHLRYRTFPAVMTWWRAAWLPASNENAGPENDIVTICYWVQPHVTSIVCNAFIIHWRRVYRAPNFKAVFSKPNRTSLHELYMLPVKRRIEYKLAAITFKVKQSVCRSILVHDPLHDYQLTWTVELLRRSSIATNSTHFYRW